METTFWCDAFGPGGKDNLRLLCGARNFRTRKNKYSTVVSFNLPTGKVKITIENRISVVSNPFYCNPVYCCYLRFDNGDRDIFTMTYNVEMVKPLLERLTGLVLDF